MLASPEFLHPIAWDAADIEQADGLLLAGEPGRRHAPYLGEHHPPGPHRARLPPPDAGGRSLPRCAVGGPERRSGNRPFRAPRQTHHGADMVTRTTGLARGVDDPLVGPRLHRTYDEEPGQPPGFMSVQQEVSRALDRETDFCDVDMSGADAAMKSSGRRRDSLDDERPAFVVEDGSYLSARWPGDCAHVRQALRHHAQPGSCAPAPCGDRVAAVTRWSPWVVERRSVTGWSVSGASLVEGVLLERGGAERLALRLRQRSRPGLACAAG